MQETPFGLRALKGLSSKIHYAIFALPMMAILVLGALYLGYCRIDCDPLYADDPSAAGYKSTSATSALSRLMPPGYVGDKTIPVPSQNFGTTCLTKPE